MSSYSSCGSSANKSRRRSKMEMNYEGNPRFCCCKVEGRFLKAPRMESWTWDNPGRRFYGCRNFKIKNCGYFKWHDEPMSARAKDVINELLDENRNLWDECKETKIKDSSEVESEISNLWDELQQLKLSKAAETEKGRKNCRMAYFIVIASWLLLFVIFLYF